MELRQTRKKATKISLALFVLMGGWWVPAGIMQNQAVYAASQQLTGQQTGISQEEALKVVKELISLPAGVKLENAQYEEAHPSWGEDKATWNFSWQSKEKGYLSVRLDAQTGTLLSFHFWQQDGKVDHNTKEITAEEAQQVAMQFLNRAAKNEAAKLSQPNQYAEGNLFYPGMTGEKTVHYTRVENGVPFLENGFDITVNGNKEITHFERRWSDEKLPEAAAKISLEEGTKKLQESIKPSLSFVRISDLAGNPNSADRTYSLVYQYQAADPVMIDANTGAALTPTGEEAGKSKPIQPLGDTVRPNTSERKLITKEEAQKIAESWIKKFPGIYHSNGSHGGGTSTGPDGIVSRQWSFEFTPVNAAKQEEGQGIVLDISDRGELVGYENQAKQRLRFEGRGEKIESPIPWKEAKEKAVAFVKSIYQDRLGEIYVAEQEPSADVLKEMLDRGRENYSIRFGWLKDGIPIDNRYWGVEIDPKDGEVLNLWNTLAGEESREIPSITGKIDAKQAVEVESKQKKAILTYFQPGYIWKFGVPPKKSQPVLVYRFVGDEGVVDAASGKWISFSELRKQNQPQDIGNHPLKDALSLAISHEILQVQDGKVEPDKAVTRAEFVSALIKTTNRIDFYRRYRQNFDDDPVAVPFQDVSSKYPYYGPIQQAVQLGLIDTATNRFEPDKPISRAEAAVMTVRLLGFEKLLNNKEIFKVPFSDVNAANTPAVALTYSLGLLKPKTATEFKPDQPLTRADVAFLYQQLQEQFGSR